MNCKEVRELMVTIRPGDVTRAQRAIVMAHLVRCKECEAFVMSAEGDDAVKAEEAARQKADWEDPEFRDIILRLMEALHGRLILACSDDG